MDDGSWLLIILFCLMIISAGYFAIAESSLSAANKIRLKARADNGEKKAKNAMYIINNFDKAISTILIGTNIAHIAAASVSTVFVSKYWDLNVGAASLICTLITTAIVFLIGEMIPKALANDRSETMALLCAGSLKFLMKVLSPLVAFFSWIGNVISKLFVKENQPSITEDELYDIIDTVEEEGVFDEDQSELFKSALDFPGTTVGDIMTMKRDIISIDVSLPNDEIIKIIDEANHSRIPVYSGDDDNIIGILQIRKFFKEYLKDPNVNVKTLLSDPYIVSKDAKIDELLTIMRKRKVYISLVYEDEKLIGLVTIEDFLEELVGEIWDEDDVVDDSFVNLGGNKFTVSTKLTVGEAFKRMGIECTNSSIAIKPIISWIIQVFGHIPEEEESFTYENLEVTVGDVEDNKVLNVTIKIKDDDETSDDEADASSETEKEDSAE